MYRKILIAIILFISIKSLSGQVKIASSPDYGALAEPSMDKIVADPYGNLYAIYRVKSSSAYQMYVYTSIDKGQNWYPIGYAPIYSFPYDQRRGSLTIGNDGKIYAVWTGADYENTNRYYDPSDGKYKYGEYQLKFSYFWKGHWSDWKNIASVEGYADWVSSSPPSIPSSIVRKYWQENPSIAVDSYGYLYVVWEGEDAHFGGSQIKFTKSIDGGEHWSHWKNLTSVTSIGTNFNQYRPSILINNNDKIFVIWDGEKRPNTYNSGKPYSEIYCITSDDLGETWSSPFQISSPNKTQRYVSGCVDSTTGNIHIVWSGRDPGFDSETKNQIRYGYYDGAWHEVPGYISKTSGWEQKYPSITISDRGALYAMWQGNDDNHPYYDEGDPDTTDDKTGHYIMVANMTNSATNWSQYQVLDKGLYPHLLKSKFGVPLSWIYTRPDGWDDFALYFDSDTNVVLPGNVKTVSISNSEQNQIYVCPNAFIPGETFILIEYVLINRTKVKLELYNIAGEKVATLLNGVRDSGLHKLYWNGSEGEFSANDDEYIHSSQFLTQGVYLLYMITQNNVKVKKIFIKH